MPWYHQKDVVVTVLANKLVVRVPDNLPLKHYFNLVLMVGVICIWCVGLPSVGLWVVVCDARCFFLRSSTCYAGEVNGGLREGINSQTECEGLDRGDTGGKDDTNERNAALV